MHERSGLTDREHTIRCYLHADTPWHAGELQRPRVERNGEKVRVVVGEDQVTGPDVMADLAPNEAMDFPGRKVQGSKLASSLRRLIECNDRRSRAGENVREDDLADSARGIGFGEDLNVASGLAHSREGTRDQGEVDPAVAPP